MYSVFASFSHVARVVELVVTKEEETILLRSVALEQFTNRERAVKILLLLLALFLMVIYFRKRYSTVDGIKTHLIG